MNTAELVGVLDGVPGTRASLEKGHLVVEIPALDDTVRLAPGDVLNYEVVAAPTGLPAVQIGVRRRHEELPLIVTVDDVVFMPAYAANLIEPGAPVLVPSAPSLVTYSEMHRDVRALGKAIDDPELDLEPEILAATLTVHRCFLAGAMRVGLWPVRVAAWWEYTAARVGAGLPQLGPFRADASWDKLMADVAEARRRTTAAAQAAGQKTGARR